MSHTFVFFSSSVDLQHLLHSQHYHFALHLSLSTLNSSNNKHTYIIMSSVLTFFLDGFGGGEASLVK